MYTRTTAFATLLCLLVSTTAAAAPRSPACATNRDCHGGKVCIKGHCIVEKQKSKSRKSEPQTSRPKVQKKTDKGATPRQKPHRPARTQPVATNIAKDSEIRVMLGAAMLPVGMLYSEGYPDDTHVVGSATVGFSGGVSAYAELLGAWKPWISVGGGIDYMHIVLQDISAIAQYAEVTSDRAGADLVNFNVQLRLLYAQPSWELYVRVLTGFSLFAPEAGNNGYGIDVQILPGVLYKKLYKNYGYAIYLEPGFFDATLYSAHTTRGLLFGFMLNIGASLIIR